MSKYMKTQITKFLKLFIILNLSILVGIVSCKSQSRAVKVGAQNLKIKIKLLNFDKNYFNPVKVVYIINCKDQRELGSVQQDNNDEVIFILKNVNANEICDISIKNLDNDISNLEFLKEEGLLYYSSYVMLEYGAFGELIGYANLQKMFRPKEGDFRMIIPVIFDEITSQDVNKLFAQFTCNPSLPTRSDKLENYDKTKKQGTFNFLIKVLSSKLTYKCSYLNVFKDGVEVYRGKFEEDLTPQPQKIYERTAPIKLETISLQDYKNFILNIEEITQCKEDEIFDITKKECVKK